MNSNAVFLRLFRRPRRDSCSDRGLEAAPTGGSRVLPLDSSKIVQDLTLVPTRFDGLDQMGTPIIRPRRTPCYFCMKCPPVCPSGALQRSTLLKEEVGMGLAGIDTKACLAWQGTLCRSCYDDCPIFVGALRMDDKLQAGGGQNPCVGCGICEHVCPVEPAAIVVQPGGRR